MKDLDDIRTIKDASEYINECLALDGLYPRHEIAAWLFGLTKWDWGGEWYKNCTPFARILDLAGEAEVSEENADSRWQWLCGAAEWLSETVAIDQ